MARTKHPKMIIGWREWVSLPDLRVPGMKAKIDTGATTSAIHAFDIEHFEHNGRRFVRFGLHPIQGRRDIAIQCEAPLVERREVKNSGGRVQRRPVILTTLGIAGLNWPIELTLTGRDSMKFRMLLGRSAMNGRLVVDPQLSYQAGRLDINNLYPELEEQ